MRLLFVFFFLLHLSLGAQETKKAVTYELGGGRFGDKLLSYLHARWISHTYDIPFFYRPFPYSDLLYLDKKDEVFKNSYKKKYKKVVFPSHKMVVDYTEDASILYIIPYFPECLWEHQNEPFYYFKVNWKEPLFLEKIRALVKPLKTIPPFIKIPSNSITVALHMRKGGGFDTEQTALKIPLKLVNAAPLYILKYMNIVCRGLGSRLRKKNLLQF